MRRLASVIVGCLTAGCAGGQGFDETETGGATGPTGGEGCPTGQLVCGGACVDPQSDAAHCGGCDQPCAGGQVCQASVCGEACPPGQVQCGDACVDTQSDPAHCGGCDAPCDPAQVCSTGSCAAECDPGLVACGGACVDTQTDLAHCGGCDQPCAEGELCQEGGCAVACTADELLCGGECVDPQASDAHCGGCDSPCPAGVACVNGSCPDYAVNHVLITGQSLSTGYAATVVSNLQLYTNLSFNTGVRAGAMGMTGFVPLVETGDGTHGETIASGMANLASSLWEAAGYTRQDMLMSAHGVDGARYELIKKGSEAYAAGVAQITAGAQIAAAQQLSYAVRAVAVVHGESDHADFVATLGNPNYAMHLQTWRADYEADAKAITGQTEPVVMLYCQMSSWTAYGSATSIIPGQQWQVARDDPEHFALVGPKYFLAYSDAVHLTGEGTRRLGEYYAKAYAKMLREGKPWRPLAPKTATLNGLQITVDFEVPVPPLVVDVEAVTDPGHYGFEFVDGSMTPPAIAGVVLTGPTEVTVTLAGEVMGPTPTIRYAYTGTPEALAGPTSGPRGNLRDSDATMSLHGYPLYNWAIHAEIAVQ